MTRRKTRDPYSTLVVFLPERPLSESILHLAAPLLEPRGPAPPPEEARRAVELAISLWNAHVTASHVWGDPRPKALDTLRKGMCGKQAPRELAATFELLSARWRAEFSLDPRLVAEWSFDATDDGPHKLVCAMALPDGVKAHVPPPAEKRIAIGDHFLDEVRIRQGATAYLSFPVEHHRGQVGADGVVRVQTKMPTVAQLFAEGRLTPIGGAPLDVMVGGNKIGGMVLAELHCGGYGGHNDVAELVFRRAPPKLEA